MILTVEQRNQGDEKVMVELYCDVAGLDFLMEKLQQLRQNGGHDHLMTPAWAGHELTEDKQGEDTELINHLCLVLREENTLPSKQPATQPKRESVESEQPPELSIEG